MGSKWAHFTCLGTPNGLGSFLHKHIFGLFLTHFWLQNNPFSRHFVTLEWPNDLQWAQNGLISLVLALRLVYDNFFWEKHILDPFFVPRQPIFKAFWDFRRAKTGQHELKTRQKHLFWAFHVVQNHFG